MSSFDYVLLAFYTNISTNLIVYQTVNQWFSQKITSLTESVFHIGSIFKFLDEQVRNQILQFIISNHHFSIGSLQFMSKCVQSPEFQPYVPGFISLLSHLFRSNPLDCSKCLKTIIVLHNDLVQLPEIFEIYFPFLSEFSFEVQKIFNYFIITFIKYFSKSRTLCFANRKISICSCFLLISK